jgi:hypothetical protein
MNVVLFGGLYEVMVVIGNANWLTLEDHIKRCDKCRACDTCRTENCRAATLMIETMLPPGRHDDVKKR